MSNEGTRVKRGMGGEVPNARPNKTHVQEERNATLTTDDRYEPIEDPILVQQLRTYIELQAQIEQHLEASPELSELLEVMRTGNGWHDFTRFL